MIKQLRKAMKQLVGKREIDSVKEECEIEEREEKFISDNEFCTRNVNKKN